jgi:hypothetical protein
MESVKREERFRIGLAVGFGVGVPVVIVVILIGCFWCVGCPCHFLQRLKIKKNVIAPGKVFENDFSRISNKILHILNSTKSSN